MTGTTAFVDAPAGLAGDMFLGALVGAGLPLRVLDDVVKALHLEGVEVRAKTVMRGALSATKVDVLLDGAPADAPTHGHPPASGHHHRTLADIVRILDDAAGLPTAAIADAKKTFGALAEAEGTVHGRPPTEIHFHEVGAVDALVDIVGTCVGLRHLGVTEVRVGPLPWGTGTVETAHGALPLPAPATVALLEGHPTFPSGETYEQVTPTGAALVRALSRATTPPARFVPRSVGLGAGTTEAGRLPNVVRLVLGDGGGDLPGDSTPSDVMLLEANLDDVTGQEAARALERALEEGALDAWTTAVTMKKGRPGLVLSVLVRPDEVAGIESLLFRETPTLGIRRTPVARSVLARRHVDVETPWGTVRMKVREGPDGPEATPEHDDCRAIAEREDVPLRRVLEAARRAYEGMPG